MFKDKFIRISNFLKNNRIILLASLIYWVIVISSSIFFIFFGFLADSYLIFYIYESFAICIAVAGILIFKYFTGLLKSKDEILLSLNLITTSVILLSIPGTFILMAIGAQLIERLPSFRPFGNEGDWINFIGIIIAGTITMLGITFTIRSEQRLRDAESKRKNIELSIISTPVMTFELSDEFIRRPRHYRMEKTNDNLIKFSLISDFFIRNTSNNFAIIDSFKLESIEIVNHFLNINKKINSKKALTYTFENGDIIPPNTSLTIQYDLDCTIEDLNSITLKLNLIYSDFMNQNKYSVDADLSLNIRIIDDDERDKYVLNGEEILLPENEFYIEVVYSKIVNKFKKL